jgi:hypothetical protein
MRSASRKPTADVVSPPRTIAPPAMTADQPELGTFSSMNSTAPMVQNRAATSANRSGIARASLRSSSVGGRSSASQRLTGAFVRRPYRVPSTSVTAR